MGRESNNNQDKQELNHHESSTTDTRPTEPRQSELTSPWPDQWQLEGLGNDMTVRKDPWPDLEGTTDWNNTSDAEEPDPTNNTSYVTPWGLFGEPRWITELGNAIEQDPKETPVPPILQHLNKDMESEQNEELSPQTSNDGSERKETLSLQNDPQTYNVQNNQEHQNERSPECQTTSLTSDDKEGMTKINHLTHQESKCPTLDNKERTTISKPMPLKVQAPPWVLRS